MSLAVFAASFGNVGATLVVDGGNGYNHNGNYRNHNYNSGRNYNYNYNNNNNNGYNYNYNNNYSYPANYNNPAPVYPNNYGYYYNNPGPTIVGYSVTSSPSYYNYSYPNQQYCYTTYNGYYQSVTCNNAGVYCGPNMHWSGSYCVCDTDYTMNYYTNACEFTYCGPNMYRAGLTCYCDQGYRMNYNTGSCIWMY